MVIKKERVHPLVQLLLPNVKSRKKSQASNSTRRAFSKVHIARGSRRTPSQVVKADVERNEHINQLQKAYTWAYSEKENYANKVKLATVASEKFDVTVVPQTLCKLIREDRSELLPSGPK